MTTEERMVRAATRNLVESDYQQTRERSRATVRLMLTVFTVACIAGIAAASSAHILPFQVTYVVAVALFVFVGLIWRE